MDNQSMSGSVVSAARLRRESPGSRRMSHTLAGAGISTMGGPMRAMSIPAFKIDMSKAIPKKPSFARKESYMESIENLLAHKR